MATNSLFRLAAVGPLVLIAALPMAPAMQAGQRAINQQRVVISVVDKDGKPVTSVTPADVTISEDGR